MSKWSLFTAVFLLNTVVIGDPTDFRARASECLEKAPDLFNGCETSSEVKQLANLYQHTVTSFKDIPEYVTISDGCLILDAESVVKSGLLAFKTTEPTQKRPFFSRADIRKTSIVPALFDSGLQLKKRAHTKNSIFFQSGKRQPKYIRASGKAKVFVFGMLHMKTMEIWVSDDAECYIENVSVSELIIHARNNTKVTIKNGSVIKKLYISSREYTTVDVAGVKAKEVILNASNGPVGTVKINASEKLITLGKSVQGSVDTTTGIALTKAIKRNVLAFKTKRIVTRSIPNFFKRTARCAFIGTKYIVVTAVSLGIIVSSAIGIAFCIFADQALHKLNEVIAPSGEKITYGTLYDLATGKTSINELGDNIKDGLFKHYFSEIFSGTTGDGSGSGTTTTIVIDGVTYKIPTGFDWSTADPAMFDAFMAASGSK